MNPSGAKELIRISLLDFVNQDHAFNETEN